MKIRKIIILLYKFKILKRIIPTTLKVFVKFFLIKEIKIIHNDLIFLLNPNNPIDREIYLKDKYESDQITFLEKKIEENDIKNFIDIGAHMGFYSINLSKKKINIYAFEPILENFIQLKKNILVNKIYNIKTYNCALSNIRKLVTMWVPDKNRTGGFAIFNKDDEALKKYEMKNVNTKVIQSDIGDNLLDIKKSMIAIKIDVERHEEEVLHGISNLLRDNKIIIQIEIFDERKRKIFSLLESKDYYLINTIKNDYYFTNFENTL
jgi:FkbM family methyltransferase